jgi:hypothetical protein
MTHLQQVLPQPAILEQQFVIYSKSTLEGFFVVTNPKSIRQNFIWLSLVLDTDDIPQFKWIEASSNRSEFHL